MRLLWYAGSSAALAASVTAYAFNQRANFYSAMVYLSQNNLSLMILINLVLLVYGSFVYGLQRLCYGQLRPVEIEQLYEKAWFAVTETCLAMTIFREEVGAWFLVMFTALVTGKVWQWIGEGRVEVLEQQPPANPGLFHTRLSISLVLSVAYDFWLFSYTVNTVIAQARPNMMVMFLFEFAVLTTDSIRTGVRYVLSLVEADITRKQTRQRLEERRKQVRDERAEIMRRRESGEPTEAEAANQEELPNEDDIDEMDIEVPGWETKGQWVLSLDLVADFVKLIVYATFFAVLMMFYGLPIHIMRDLFMTTRSFLKRLSALVRYRKALQDMNKYPDATAEELARENTCIICREDMRPWQADEPGAVERSRPKKLPCGHILHFGCLKSWLERQQVCPTCRRSVVVDGAVPQANTAPLNMGGQQPIQGQGGPDNRGPNGAHGGPGRPAGMRMFQFGPLRLGFAQGNPQNIQEIAQRFGMPLDAVNAPAVPAAAPAAAVANPPVAPVPPPPQVSAPSAGGLHDVHTQLRDIATRLQQEMHTLQTRQAELHMTHMELQTTYALNAELNRLRQLQQQVPNLTTPAPADGAQQPQFPLPAQNLHPVPSFPPVQQMGQFAHFPPRVSTPSFTRHATGPWSTPIPAGSPDLPEGVVIPQGWTLMPLQRMDGGQAQPATAQSSEPQSETPNRGRQEPPAQANSSETTGPSSNEALASSSAESSSTQELSGPDSQPPAAPSQAQTEPPQVAAPTPVAPNWGGAAQLFANRTPSTSGIFPSGNSEPGTKSETATSDHSDGEQHESSGQDKGKSKAVTVEDVEGEEEH